MKSNLLRRLLSLLATAGLVAGMTVAIPAAVVLAATDPGCTALGGVDGAGTCDVPAGTHVVAGPILVDEHLHLATGAILDASGSGVSLTVGSAAHHSNFVMDIGSAILADGDNISVTVPFGDMTMHGTAGTDRCGYVSPGNTIPYAPHFAEGAVIRSFQATITTTVTIKVGNYPNNTAPAGSFNMERCSVIDVTNIGGSAGTVIITAGHDADLDGLVLSESTLSGTGASQAPGGGPITVQVGCVLRVSSTGVVSSKGRDPGADLVHLEGCDVFIDGLVQSTGPGHAPPNNPANHCHTNGPNGDHSAKPAISTACVEIIGQNITISNTGEVNADVNSTGDGGPQGSSWIDLFAYDNITINGRTAAGTQFSVHANTASGTDTTPNTVTAIAGHDLDSLGTFSGSGRILAASIIGAANGSSGGAVVVQASGPVILNTGTVMAAGDNVGSAATSPCDTGSGACGSGGSIDVRSFQSSITWLSGVGDVNPDEAPSDVIPPVSLIGTVALTACTTVNTTGTNFDDTTPTVLAATYTNSAGVTTNPGTGVCAPLLPTVPAYVEAAFAVGEPIWEACVPFSPPDKSGLKWNDLNGNGVRDGGEPVIGNWPINLYGPGAPFAPFASTTTDAVTGVYHFTIPSPGPWRVCEGVSPLPGTWNQTFPNALTPSPNAQGEAIVNTCPGPNVWGYEFTATSGLDLVNNDFGNHKQDVCQKPTAIAIMNEAFPGNAGPDVVVHTDAGQSVQAAVNAASDLNGDHYVIIFVIGKADNSLGGSANQKVVISQDYTLNPASNFPFGLIGCSVTLTAGGTGPAVWIQSSAKGAQWNLNGHPTNILVADLHGGNSAVGVQADGTLRYLRNEAANGNGVGILVNGNNNTVHNGAANSNTSDGLQVNGNNNYLTDTNSMGNGGNGFNVTGNSNQLLKLDAGEKSTPNTTDGVRVTGSLNKLSEIDAFNNGRWGINVIGNTNQLLKNVAGASGKGNGFGAASFGGIRVSGLANQLSENQANFNIGAGNTGIGFTISAGSAGNTNKLLKNTTSTNSGNEFVIGATNTDQGGNKKPAAFTFGAAGGNFN